MKTPVWTVAALVAGVAIMLLGPWFVARSATTLVWNDQQAQAYSKAAAELHSASYGGAHSHSPGHQHSHQPPPPDDPGLLAARAAFEEQKANLDRAIARQGWYVVAIRALGILVTGAGVAGYVWTKSRSEGSDWRK